MPPAIKSPRWLHVPRRSVRLRLTLLYGSLFLASGAVVLTITDLLWRNATVGRESVSPVVANQVLWSLHGGGPVFGVLRPAPGPAQVFLGPLGPTPAQLRSAGVQLRIVALQQHHADLHLLIVFSALAIAVMALLAVVLGWLMAGRVLRPLRTITSAARDISVTNLHERLALSGPDDELKELGDTFDGLLERLEGSFQAQRQFVANASHELRTPLATMRASLDVAAGKPGPVPEHMITLADRLRDELDNIDRLLESLLALARAQRGSDDDTATLSLADLASAGIEGHSWAIAQRGLTVEQTECPEASVSGSETLLFRMADNMIDNAVKHNTHGGWVKVRTECTGRVGRLIVENGGPVIDIDSVGQLAQPFRRLGVARTGSDDGSGLGLSIVAAVAEAHGGRLELDALSGGGLRVVIELPLAVGALVGASA